MTDPYADELKYGLEAVRKAAAICQVVQNAITPEVLDKKDNSPVTIADFASQAVICHEIGNAFPSDPIIAEEDSTALRMPENCGFERDIHSLIQEHYRSSTTDEIQSWIDRGGAKENSPRFWTLDPIDGTKGFVRRDQYAVSLALIVDGQIEIGILGCPNFGTLNKTGHSLFYAVRGQGAYSTSLESDCAPQQIHVTSTSDPAQSRFCESFESGHSSHNTSSLIATSLGITQQPIRMDSQAKYAAVAAGMAEAYLRLPTKTGYWEKIWDHAGGALVLQEAGGTVTDIYGKPLDFSQGYELRQNRGVIVTNGQFHDAILATIAQHIGNTK